MAWLLGVLVLLGGCGEVPDAEPIGAASSAGATVAAPVDIPSPEVEPAAGTPTVAPSPTGEAPPTADPEPDPQTEPVAEPESGTALAALLALEVKGRAPMTGYDRARFGQAWLDADRNGCDTRNDMLRRDLTSLTFKPGTGGCVALSGVLEDRYTGRQVHFERGGAADVDIDHVVALGNAWATGAARWGIKRRAAFANDPLALLAAEMGANRQKGDGDAATWLPPNKSFRCAYVARQVAVKAKYDLWVTRPEKSAIRRVLADCPGQELTADRWHAPTEVDHDVTDPGVPRPTPAPSPTQPQGLVGGSVHYENCTAVRAAGADPIRRGDPGYDKHLDRDGDGIGCE